MRQTLTKRKFGENSTTNSNPPPQLPAFPLLPNLPNDVALQCIARVPPYHYPSLSLVSKTWRSTVRSPLLYTTRSLLNCTQHFLYLNLRVNSSFTWFFLHQNPTNPKRRRTLSPLPPIPSQPIGSAFAVLGPKIYVIGGAINQIPSNTIWVFDCRFNRWELGPKMRVCREFAAAGAAGGKIYVIGGCLVDNWARSVNWAEVFDPVAGSWTAVPSPIEVRDKWMHASAVIFDKIYANAVRGGVVYDAVAGEWDDLSTVLDKGWSHRGKGAAVVDGVLYIYGYYHHLWRIMGYDVEEDVWKELKWVDNGLPECLYCGVTMANVGGKLFVVWEGKGSGKEMEIMCAEIEVWKDRGGGLSGSIVWSDVILDMVPRYGSSIAHCAAVEL
ncbi:hypothetical protein U1Q18_004542 [Sarracenia purpurea var. burkii]